MRKNWKLLIVGSALVLTSRTALAHADIGFGFSIVVPGASAYVDPAPAYYPLPVYAAPPAGYYEVPPGPYYATPPQVYYAAPPQIYYDAPPAVSIYYRPSDEEFGRHRYWRRDRSWGDDDD